jgi:hypothetical protein
MVVNSTMMKGTRYRKRNPIINPILSSGKDDWDALRRWMSEVAAKEIDSMKMMSVRISTDMSNDQKNVLFFSTLKIICIAFSIDEKRGRERAP